MKPTFAQLVSFELNLETATAALLKRAGLSVVSPFVRLDADGKPAEPTPEDYVTVHFELAEIDDNVKVFRTDADGVAYDAIGAGWEGDLVVTHQVAFDDQPAPVGEPIGPYPRILRQRGLIRALMLGAEHDDPFKDSLPWYSILSVRCAAPDRRVDPARSVNQATERFRIRFTAKRGAI